LAVPSKSIGLRWEDIRHAFRAPFLTLGLVLTVHSAIAADASPIVSEARDSEAAPEGPMTFDLPAQPLVSALEAYGAATGRQVVYESRLASGRRSTAVKGSLTAEAALRRLLAGTGIVPRYMAADGFVLVPEPAPVTPPTFPINTAPLPVVTQYYGRIQAGLRQSFCADERVRSRGYRVAVGFWIGASGAVTRSVLLDSTGDRGLDATLGRDLRKVNVGEAPPVGFAQPVVMVITPDAVRECQAGQDGMQQIKAGP
jgi:TonB family protein